MNLRRRSKKIVKKIPPEELKIGDKVVVVHCWFKFVNGKTGVVVNNNREHLYKRYKIEFDDRNTSNSQGDFHDCIGYFNREELELINI